MSEELHLNFNNTDARKRKNGTIGKSLFKRNRVRSVDARKATYLPLVSTKEQNQHKSEGRGSLCIWIEARQVELQEFFFLSDGERKDHEEEHGQKRTEIYN